MHYLFVTGKLAAPALREQLHRLAPLIGFQFEVIELGISVAALMTPRWVASHWPAHAPIADRIMVPGGCTGDWHVLQQQTGLTVEKGPVDLRDLDDHFGLKKRQYDGRYDIEIITEINHAPRYSPTELLQQAQTLQAAGADVIDLGCIPGQPWQAVAEAVKRLRGEGFRVSIDSFDVHEVAIATQAGAELVLSVNQSNFEASRDWGCEVVAIPDAPDQLASLDRTVEHLTLWNVPHRLDPILEPIGMGFTASLARYMETRRRFPGHEILMGIGNLTELTEVDSHGVNAILIGICQELGIRSVLTTQVINWARNSVAEIDVARRLMFHAVNNRVIPKHVDSRLVMLHDPKVPTSTSASLKELWRAIKDRHFRIFADADELHLMNAQQYEHGADPFVLFQNVAQQQSITADHAFYLGYELAKAQLALLLGKRYEQDEPLAWGFLNAGPSQHRHAPVVAPVQNDDQVE